MKGKRRVSRMGGGSPHCGAVRLRNWSAWVMGNAAPGVCQGAVAWIPTPQLAAVHCRTCGIGLVGGLPHALTDARLRSLRNHAICEACEDRSARCECTSWKELRKGRRFLYRQPIRLGEGFLGHTEKRSQRASGGCVSARVGLASRSCRVTGQFGLGCPCACGVSEHRRVICAAIDAHPQTAISPSVDGQAGWI